MNNFVADCGLFDVSITFLTFCAFQNGFIIFFVLAILSQNKRFVDFI